MTSSPESIWRERATAAELAQVAAWDARLDELAQARRDITAERAILTNRALQRGRYHRRKNLSHNDKELVDGLAGGG